MTAATVTSLALTAIKGTHLQTVDELELTATGARGDRRFFLVDERGRLFNGKRSGALQTVASVYDDETATLCLTLPGGTVVQGTVTATENVEARAYGGCWNGRLVAGPWATALSELTGHELRLLMTASAVDRGDAGAVSLMSSASLRRLATAAGRERVDGRRFRMMVEVEGPEAHAEDAWVERTVRIGGARVHFEGHIGRCRVTTLSPDSGEVDLPTLDLLRDYRSGLETTEPLAFGIHGRVLDPGHIRVGDRVEVE